MQDWAHFDGFVFSMVVASFVAGLAGNCVVALAQALLQGQLNARWRHGLWLLVVIRLGLPHSRGNPLELVQLGQTGVARFIEGRSWRGGCPDDDF